MIDELRSNARTTYRKLRNLGIKVVILVNDHEIKARETAKELGLTLTIPGFCRKINWILSKS